MPKDQERTGGKFLDLFGDARWRKHALLGMALAAVGWLVFGLWVLLLRVLQKICC